MPSFTTTSLEDLRGQWMAMGTPAARAEAVVSNMVLHRNRDDVQSAGCSAIEDLAKAGNTEKTIGRFFEPGDSSAIEATMEAMRVHADVAEVQVTGCRALGMLARRCGSSERLLLAMLSAGVHVVIIDAMQNHWRDAEVQFSGCKALKWMALRSGPAQCSELMQAGALRQMLLVVEVHGLQFPGAAEEPLIGLQRLLRMAVEDGGSVSDEDLEALVAVQDLLLQLGTTCTAHFPVVAFILAYCPQIESLTDSPGSEPEAEAVVNLNAAAASMRVSAWTSLQGAAILAKDLILPVSDSVMDVVNMYSFYTHRQRVWFDVLAASLCLHSFGAAALAVADGCYRLAAADVLTFGTASILSHVVESFRRGVKMPSVLTDRLLEAVESMASFGVTADSLVAAASAPNNSSNQSLGTGTLTCRWVAVVTSVVCLALLALDMDKVAAYHSRHVRNIQLQSGLATTWRCFCIFAFHTSEVACMLVVLVFIKVSASWCGPILLAVSVCLCACLHTLSLTWSLDGDWEVVSGDGQADDRGMQFSFYKDCIVGYQGQTWPLVLEKGSRYRGTATTNQCEFSLSALTADVMVWSAGSYAVAEGPHADWKPEGVSKQLVGHWKLRVLVRVETLKFYSRECDGEAQAGMLAVMKRILLSFVIFVPLLVVVAPVGQAHPRLLWQLAWLKPLLLVTVWAAIAALAVIDEVACDVLLRPINLSLLTIAAVALLLYIPLAFHEHRCGRWREAASMQVDGTYQQLDTLDKDPDVTLL